MILFLCAQDLQSIWIGLIQNSTFLALEQYEVPPEGYLNKLDHFLHKQNLLSSSLEAICLVTGPGSFTSSRITLTIANTLHFVHGTTLFMLENPDHLTPKDLWSKNGLGNQVEPGHYAHAFYDRPPHITKPRGDKPLE